MASICFEPLWEVSNLSQRDRNFSTCISNVRYFLRRYSTLAGSGQFTSKQMPQSSFDGMQLEDWRNKVTGQVVKIDVQMFVVFQCISCIFKFLFLLFTRVTGIKACDFLHVFLRQECKSDEPAAKSMTEVPTLWHVRIRCLVARQCWKLQGAALLEQSLQYLHAQA